MLATVGIYVCEHKSKAQPHDVAPDSVVTPYSIATVATQVKPRTALRRIIRVPAAF